MYDEAPAAARTAKQLGLQLDTAPCTARDLARGFLPTLFHVESPLNNPNSVAKRMLSAHATARGYKVCLTGEGADELFGGYAFFKLERLWSMMLGPPEAARSAEELWRLFQKVEHRTEGILWRKRMSWRQPEYAWGYPSYFRRSLEQVDRLAPRLLAPGIVAASGGKGPIAALDRELTPASLRALDPFDASRAVSLSVLASYIIPTLGDRVEMANSLECRTPFLDVDLAEYALTLPSQHFLRIESLREKYVLREAFADILPPAVREEPKHPFMAPTWHALYATREGREIFEDLLSRRALERTGVLSPRFVRGLRALWRWLPPSWGQARVADLTVGMALGIQGVSRTLIESPPQATDELEMEDRSPGLLARPGTP
jgi:asparagine synthase (glutamine-hydrolysing)